MNKKIGLSVFIISIVLFFITENSFAGLYAVSKDGRYLAISEYEESYNSAVGCANVPGWITIVDSFTKKVVKKITTSYGCADPKYENMPEEKLTAINDKLGKEVDERLKREGYSFAVKKKKSAVISVYKVENGPERDMNNPAPDITVSLYLKDNESGFKMLIKKFVERGGLQNIDDEFHISPDNKTFVVFYKTAYIMEFEEGHTGYMIINRYDLAKFATGAGMVYYKQKKYDRALKFFKNSLKFDQNYARAVFNTACMYGLKKDIDKVMEYLNRLKSMKTRDSNRYLKMVKKERDFAPVRNHPKFKAFVNNI